VTLASIGATQQIAATVLDQNGNAMASQKVTWASTAAGVATVDSTGQVTAVANGSAQVTATAGAASKGVPVTVQQVAAQLSSVSGDGQSGTVGQPLAQPLVVVAKDALGTVMAGASVTFAVTAGNGMVPPGALTTAANGQASTTFTLGTVAGSAHQVTATATGVATGVTFGATAAAGAAAAISKQAGDGQTVAVNTAVAPQPQVKVTDSFGNAKSGVGVTFAVASGGGGVTGATQTTDANGLATVGSWTVGGSAGANTLTATVNGTAISTTFSATAAIAGSPANVAAFVGDNQRGLVGYALNVRPAVRVTDSGGLPVAGASVTFAVGSGGGSVTGATVSTSSNGVAQVGAWTAGASPGSNTLTATVTGSGITGNPVTFTANAQNGAYDIVVRNVGPAFSPAVQAAFTAAVQYWQSAIYGDLSDVPLTNIDCGIGPLVNETVDDILILARFDSIDGPGQILGQASAFRIRSSNGLPVCGYMVFDTADVAALVANGSLNAVILHEMAHVLGFTTGIWNTQPDILQQRVCAQNVPQPAQSGLDSHFTCTQAGATNQTVAEFDSIGGTSFTGGSSVPLENCTGLPSGTPCGVGTLYVHWRESAFGNELMTGYLNSGTANPLSVVTIAQFGDNGYLVNYAAAQAYSHTFTAPSVWRGGVIDLSNDVPRVPIGIVDDRTGRLLRVVQP
jgi:hypothetical protein